MTLDRKGQTMHATVKMTAAPSDRAQLGTSTVMLGGLRSATDFDRSRTSSMRSLGGVDSAPSHAHAHSDSTPTPVSHELIALCNTAGSLQLHTPSQQLWELHVDHSLFALAGLDLTGDGNDEMVAVAWDGATFVVDQHKRVVFFPYREDICSFAGGLYAIAPGRSVPCFVYVSTAGTVEVFHSIHLPPLDSESLLDPRLGLVPTFNDTLHRIASHGLAATLHPGDPVPAPTDIPHASAAPLALAQLLYPSAADADALGLAPDAKLHSGKKPEDTKAGSVG